MTNEKSTAAEEIKPPNPAVVERAQTKMNEGAELSDREAAALEAQAAVDAARGYREVDWKGQTLFQSLVIGHTAASEYEIVQYHAGLHHAKIKIA